MTASVRPRTLPSPERLTAKVPRPSSRGQGRALRPSAAHAEPPTVSVVIPCYNYGRYLEGCVRSVVAQSGVRVRILVIDDASTDDSADTARRLEAELEEVETWVHTTNKGHIATYNEGLLEWATGEFVTLLSADDELTEGSLARSVSIMQADPDVGMVYGGIEEFRASGTVSTTASRPRAPLVYDGMQWLGRRCREAVNTVPTPGTTLRTSVQRQVGGYDASLPHAADLHMWLRVAAVSDVGYVRGTPQGRYRLHETSMSGAVYSHSLGDIAQRKLVFDDLFARHGQEMAEAGISRDDTYRRLASQPLWWACRAYEKGHPDPAEVAAWSEFAAATYPASETLPAHRALRRRQVLGPRLCSTTRVFIGTTVARRLQDELWWHRWRRSGG
jgi:hypothetical protein